MQTTITQIRFPKKQLYKIDEIVKKGMYANKSDFVRDAVRRLIWNLEVGTIKNTGDSVKEVRKIRQILSKKGITLREINSA